jgi:hypothetical protein
MKRGRFYSVSFGIGAALFLCIFLTSEKAVAHSTGDTSTAKATSSTNTQNAYVFTAAPGDSLSIFVRRALQLGTKLEPAAALYCENTVVNSLGAYELEIGQQVTIPFGLIDTCQQQAKGLSADQVAAWQTYVPCVSFDMTGIEPVSAPAQSQTNTGDNSTDDKGTTEDPSPQPESSESESDTGSRAASYWWYIGAATLVILYFVLGGRLPRLPKR